MAYEMKQRCAEIEGQNRKSIFTCLPEGERKITGIKCFPNTMVVVPFGNPPDNSASLSGQTKPEIDTQT